MCTKFDPKKAMWIQIKKCKRIVLSLDPAPDEVLPWRYKNITLLSHHNEFVWNIWAKLVGYICDFNEKYKRMFLPLDPSPKWSTAMRREYIYTLLPCQQQRTYMQYLRKIFQNLIKNQFQDLIQTFRQTKLNKKKV